MRKPSYGGTGWHVFINLVLGVSLLVAALAGWMFLHHLLLLLLVPSAYFIYTAIKWGKKSGLEERLRIRDEVIRLVQPKDGDRILDVGTGGGLLAIGFAKAVNCESVGLDTWVKLGGGTSLRNAKRNAETEGVADRVKFVEGDARNIPYPNDYFDAVVASFVVHVIRREREKALREMIRVLRPGGKFAIVEPPRGLAGWAVGKKLKKKLEEIGLKKVEFKPLQVSYPKERHVYIIYGEKNKIISQKR